MARRYQIKKRKVLGDSIYNDVKIAQFINKIMHSGKKSIAENIFYSSLKLISEKLKKNPKDVFLKIIANCSPRVEVRSKRLGGATYQIPTEIKPYRQDSLAMRWLISSARSRSEKSFVECLFFEFMDAYHNNGKTIKKRDEMHKIAEANKAFAYFK